VQVNFGSGSSVATVALSWNMWYPLPLPPHNTTYHNEFGLHVHLVPADARNLAGAFSAAATALASLTGFGAVFDGLVNIVAQAAISFVENSDGSMDIQFSTHGFQVGNAGAFDPTVVLPGLWAAVMSGLQAAAHPLGAVDHITLTAKLAPVEHPHSDGPAAGLLAGAEPSQAGELISATPIADEVPV